jgi:hypothetical protein
VPHAAQVINHDGVRPPQSREHQRRAALQRANVIRVARAALRRAIHDGERRVADVVATCPPEAASMSVGELLVAQHRWGESRAQRILRRIPLSETKALGTLTLRQQNALVELLGGTSGAAVASVPPAAAPARATPGTTGHRSAAGTSGAAD